MSEDRKAMEARRRFLKIVGSSAALVPIVGLTACSDKKDTAAATAKPKAMETESKAAAPAEAPTKPSGMAQLSEDDPQAKSLAYVHDATKIDGANQPRFKTGQNCSNCALFQGKANQEWAGCSIFPGKAVNAAGWCTVYAPKPS